MDMKQESEDWGLTRQKPTKTPKAEHHGSIEEDLAGAGRLGQRGKSFEPLKARVEGNRRACLPPPSRLAAGQVCVCVGASGAGARAPRRAGWTSG
eukprot:4707695-Pleurochrysis_carterae.AAC.2